MAKRKQINEDTFNKIRRLLDYGLKQQEVADIIGCSKITIQRISRSEARDYETWRAVVKTYNQPKPKKLTEAMDGVDEAETEDFIVTSPYDMEIPGVAVEKNETADAIRELTAVMRELVEAWEGNQAKKRRLF